jgi:hypothetical protein
MSCIIITWHCRDHFLVMYDTQSGITIGDALSTRLIWTYTDILLRCTILIGIQIIFNIKKN